MKESVMSIIAFFYLAAQLAEGTIVLYMAFIQTAKT